MSASLEQLVLVRSQLAEDLRGYYETLIDTLDRTPWYRQGRMIRASTVAIPARVLKEETKPPPRPMRERESDDDDEHRREPARAFVDPEIAALYEEPTLLKRREEVAWQDEQRQGARAVIIGSPGGGKSFLTETTAVELAQSALAQLQEQRTPLDSLAFPIHLELTDLTQQGLPADLADALLALLKQQYRLSARLEAWMREKLRTEHCWLILDALDQVDERARPRLNDRLRAMETQGWQCRVVLTCRTANYDRAQVPWGTLTAYELAPFRPQEIRQFIEKWFGQGNGRGEVLRHVLDRNFALSHACRSPLLVTLTCLAHEEGAVTEETRRVDLYAQVLRGLARRAWRENPLNPQDPHIDDLLRLLEPVARKLFEQRPASNKFTDTEVIAAIEALRTLPLPLVLRQQLSQQGLPDGFAPLLPTLLRDELRDIGILVGAGLSRSREAQFSFLHRTFLAYLTACTLARQGWQTIAALVDKKAWLPEWQEVMVLLAGKLADPKPLLTMLSKEEPTKTNPYGDDHFRHRLALAALCLPEIHSAYQTPNSELFDSITTAAFTRWWQHAVNSTFEATPNLARALPALGQVRAKIDAIPLATHLARLLTDADGDVRETAVRAVGGIGSAAATPEILALLARRLTDADGRVREAAVRAVGGIGSAAATPEILASLARRLTDADRGVRGAAAGAVGRFMAQGVRLFQVSRRKWIGRSVEELSR